MNRRLLIITHVLVRDYAGRHYIQGGLGRHVDGLARRFDHIYILTCVGKANQPLDEYSLQADDLTVIPLPNYRAKGRLTRYVLMLWAMSITMLKLPRALQHADVIHPRIPSVIGGLGAFVAKFADKPMFVYVGGDWEAIYGSRSPKWLMRRLGHAFTRVVRYLIRDKPCFVAGDALFAKLANQDGMVRSVIPTTLNSEHILDRAPPLRPLDREVKLLFVGAVNEAKGIDYLLQATAAMVERGMNVQLRIIGQVADEGHALFEQLTRPTLRDRVACTGRIAWDRLINEYEKSDIFVLPSTSEGVPKVVLESMARGVPVVVTNVGGVATLVRDGENGLLIEPRSVAAIVTAIQRLIEDNELRARLIAHGLDTARCNTLDYLIDEMCASVCEDQHWASGAG
jgi:glycosyltransferase involved in cell wall biosynthesis